MRDFVRLNLAVAVFALASAAATPTHLRAQSNNASINVTATVDAPINVLGAQGLNFGNAFPGVNKTVDATDLTNAGRFEITGQSGSPVTLTFTLPSTLSFGGNTLPIVSYTGVHAEDAAQTAGVAFTPSTSGTSTALSAGGGLFVWVGAQVQPATNQ